MRFGRIAAVLVVLTMIAVPSFAARGHADFTRFVALGDSYGAGVESGSLNERHQVWSWPNVIARQTGAPDFVQPLVSFPGIGAELQLVNATTFPPVITPAAGAGAPINPTFPRPFNNLAIPGANVNDLTTLRGNEANPVRTPEQFARFILRGQGTAVQQAIALQPTFIAIWIGGNDFLGSVLSGTPAALTSTTNFRTAYNAMLDQLTAGAPNAGMIVGTLPQSSGGSLFRSVPLTSAVASVIINPATRTPVLGPNGQPIPLIANLGDGTIGPLPTGSIVLLTAATKLATGFGIPPQLAQVPPFNALPNAGQPLADTDVLTPTEIGVIETRVAEYNQVIIEAARAKDIPVADIAGLYARMASGRLFVGPFNVTGSFITGGFFSLDGFHLSDLGYMLFANQYIRTINEAYDTEIPLASITQLFENNGAFFGAEIMTGGGIFVEGMPWEMSHEARKQMLQFASPASAKIPQ